MAVTVHADAGFVATLPADDFAHAGLKKLSPDELRWLESVVQRYKADAAPPAAAPEARTKAGSAEARSPERAPPAPAASSAAAERQPPGWFTALLTLRRAGEKPDKEEALESRLVGDFSGWNGRSIFTLENGTRWLQQNESESYPYAPVLHSPKVWLRPAALHGFWLEIEGVNLQVRVTPWELPARK